MKSIMHLTITFVFSNGGPYNISTSFRFATKHTFPERPYRGDAIILSHLLDHLDTEACAFKWKYTGNEPCGNSWQFKSPGKDVRHVTYHPMLHVETKEVVVTLTEIVERIDRKWIDEFRKEYVSRIVKQFDLVHEVKW